LELNGTGNSHVGKAESFMVLNTKKPFQVGNLLENENCCVHRIPHREIKDSSKIRSTMLRLHSNNGGTKTTRCSKHSLDYQRLWSVSINEQKNRKQKTRADEQKRIADKKERMEKYTHKKVLQRLSGPIQFGNNNIELGQVLSLCDKTYVISEIDFIREQPVRFKASIAILTNGTWLIEENIYTDIYSVQVQNGTWVEASVFEKWEPIHKSERNPISIGSFCLNKNF
jgi:hypothetical protein